MNDKLKLLITSLCLTLCYSNNIKAMENEIESMQTRIDRIKRSLNKSNINDLKMYIPNKCIHHIYNTPGCSECGGEARMEKRFIKQSYDILRLIDDIQYNYNLISSLKKQIISNINYLKEHGAQQDICNEITEFINININNISISEIAHLIKQKWLGISKYLREYDSRNNTKFLGRFKNDIIRLLEIEFDTKNKSERILILKHNVSIYIRNLKNNGAPANICDEIINALS